EREHGLQSGYGHFTTRDELASLPPPTLCERRHRCLATLSIAVRRRAILVVAKGQRPEPRRIYRRGRRLHDPADDDAIGNHVVVVVTPLARDTRGRRALEDQIVLVHLAAGNVSWFEMAMLTGRS